MIASIAFDTLDAELSFESFLLGTIDGLKKTIFEQL
jgi:hypothetical protein